MGEERKEYSIVGTVTIGTDEYRDLIEACKDLEKKADENSDKWYREYSRAIQLEKELNSVKDKLEKYKKFIDANKEKYELWIIKDTEL